MITVRQLEALNQRLEKAREIVAQGRVLRIFGQEHTYVALNGQGNAYLVRWDGQDGSCTCPDFVERASKVGMICKHIMAAQLLAEQAAKQNGGRQGEPAVRPKNGADRKATGRRIVDVTPRQAPPPA